ncbi:MULTISPECIES: Uma2 family endonuclease [Sorangium]|uniref:Uma2 family endonuclease n=1 Tax=Sorangium TaxID=39643 RepID=UPI00214FF4D9|nr:MULTISPECIES: Uma2 family endonuclease [Sorangium]
MRAPGADRRLPPRSALPRPASSASPDRRGGRLRHQPWWKSVLAARRDAGAFGASLPAWPPPRIPALPKAPPGGAVAERPDWVAEVLSSSTAARDLGDKRSIYHAAGVGHYWVLDPANRLLIVYRWAREGYLFALSAGAGEPVRAEPFEALELRVELLFGDEGEPEAAAPRP